MTSKGLEILRRTTKPKSRDEVQKFLERRHGAVERENASADPSALDDRARGTIPTPRKKMKA